MRTVRWFSSPPPGINLTKTSGALIVIEGPDASGRTTQISMLTEWLEQQGFSVAQIGLKRSQLVSKALEKAKAGNILSPRTLSLFYATDFYDQFENRIIPALRAGQIVLADRYIFTLIARDVVRGADRNWVKSVYSKVIIPDTIFFLKASTRTLLHRTLASRFQLDYWESGMDIGLSRDWYESFVRYQRKIQMEFARLAKEHDFQIINANRSIKTVNNEIKFKLGKILHNISQKA